MSGVILLTNVSGDKIMKNDMWGACGMYGVERNAYRTLVGKP
jgi:hypothetical protein